VNEDVSWIAVEAGAWVNNEGTGGFQAGTAAAQGAVWETIKYHANSGRDHAVMTHVQTIHDPHFVKTRQQSVDQDGFQVMLEQIGQSSEVGLAEDGSPLQVNAHVHGVETIGWLAVAVGIGSLGNVKYEAGVTSDDVSHEAYTINFKHAFELAPRFFGSISSHNGWDASQLRQDTAAATGRGQLPVTATSASFVIEEESCGDDESDCDEYIAGNGCHGNTESVAWLAMSQATEGGHVAGYNTLSSQTANTIQAKPYPRWHRNMGEVGTATVNTNWVQVRAYGDYRNPQVFCGVPSRVGGDAVACRITGKRHTVAGTEYMSQTPDDDGNKRVQAPYRCVDEDDDDAWCFFIALQEPSCLDQWHTDEEVSWMIMDEGSWLSDNGKQIQVGQATVASGGWTWVPYHGTGFSNSPVTITQIQTFKGAYCTNDDGSGTNTAAGEATCTHGLNDAINENNDIPNIPTGFTKTRQTKNSMGSPNSGYHEAGTGEATRGQLRKDTMHFFVTLEVEGGRSDHPDGVVQMDHIQETVGWAAFDVAHSSLGGVVYEAGKTGFEVTDAPHQIQFSGYFRTKPELFANIGSYNGDDSAEVRLFDSLGDGKPITYAYATVQIEEEMCTGEQGGFAHGRAEEVDYFAVNKGIGASADRPRGGMIASQVIGAGEIFSGEGGGTMHQPFAETGDLTLSWSWSSNWQTVSLKHYFIKPAIIMGSPTTTGPDAVTLRIRNLRHGQGCDGWCFDVRLQEPPCLDGGHGPELVNYLVVETGSWMSDEGTMLQAGVNEVEGDMRLTGQQFQIVSFHGTGFPAYTQASSGTHGYSGGGLPVVLTQVMSSYGANFVNTRQQQVDSDHFLVALEEVGSFAGTPDTGQDDTIGTQGHTNVEKVGWVAFEPAVGNFGTRNFEAGHTPESVTHEDYAIKFQQQFDAAPRFFARMATYYGTDSSQVRHTGAATKGVSVHVEEETCTDAEQNHVAEIVDYVAFEASDQIMMGRSNLPLGCQGVHDATKAQLVGAKFDPQTQAANTAATGAGAESTGGVIGTGIINFEHNDGDTATWEMRRCLQGHYTIAISYALYGGNPGPMDGDRPLSVTVNDEVVDGYLAMPATGSWSTYREVRVAVKMKAGLNTITLSAIGLNGPNIDYIAIVPIGSSGAGDTTTIGQVGVAETIDYRDLPNGDPEEQWVKIELSETILDPVVILGVSTSMGGQPVVGRIRNLQYSNPYGNYFDSTREDKDDGCAGTCFDLRLQEPTCMDDVHIGEEIHWMVLESGSWYTDEGTLFQAGHIQIGGANVGEIDQGGSEKADLAGGWMPITYHTPFPDDNVAVLTQVQTYNDPHFIKTRNRPLGANAGYDDSHQIGTYGAGFEVALERENSSGDGETNNVAGAVSESAAHGLETVGYVAFQHGKGSIGGDLYQASISADVVTHDPATGAIAFCAGFTDAPLFCPGPAEAFNCP
jgi:hypothetical protein